MSANIVYLYNILPAEVIEHLILVSTVFSNKSAAGKHDTPPWKVIRTWLQRLSNWHS